VHDKEAAGAQVPSLVFPVRVAFSKGLRPRRFRGKIEFRNVFWAPPTDTRKMILNGLSFVVEPGQKVALVGPTGCGKSSTMALLQRLYDPTGGEILIDDIPIADYDVHHLRSRIVIVDQSTVLFNTTIKENITYGLPYSPSDAEIEQACRDAKAWDFIASKPDGLMTVLHDGGKNLSGGQRQRLAIARAMIRKPDVILLDEATSALDNENEAKVQEALDIFARRGSALVIAHRLSTIKDSDNICVIDGGVVAESGSHDELLGKLPCKEIEARPSASTDAGCECPHTCFADALQLPPSGSPRLRHTSSSDTPSPTLGRSRNSVAQTGDGNASLHMPMPQVRRAKTLCAGQGYFSSRRHAKPRATYKGLWNAAIGDQDKTSLAQIRKKLVDLEAEMAALRCREGDMLRIKNALVTQTAVH